MQYPLVSICIPSYNHENYILECLDSALEEDYPNKEIIIINDGSKDNSDALIKEWINKNKQIPVTYKSRENKGITKTFNELISLANGQYIAIIASDDAFKNNSISKRIKYLEQKPDKMAVFGDAVIIDENSNTSCESALFKKYSANKNKLSNDKGIREEFIKNWSMPGPVLLIKKEAYDIVGSYDENLSVEDWDFYLRLASKNLICFYDDIVAKYRVHSTNTCANEELRLNQYDESTRVIQKNIHLFSPLEKLWLLAKLLNFKKKIAKYSLFKLIKENRNI